MYAALLYDLSHQILPPGYYSIWDPALTMLGDGLLLGSVNISDPFLHTLLLVMVIPHSNSNLNLRQKTPSGWHKNFYYSQVKQRPQLPNPEICEFILSLLGRVCFGSRMPLCLCQLLLKPQCGFKQSTQPGLSLSLPRVRRAAWTSGSPRPSWEALNFLSRRFPYNILGHFFPSSVIY